MKKKIFLTGKVYDLSTITVQEIIDDVQSRLDTYYGKNRIRFTLNVDKQAKEVIINFWRSYNEWHHPEETNNIFCIDMDLITGRGIEGFAVPCMWPTAPFGYYFSTGIDDFIPYYKKSAKELGASRMKDIMITHDKDNLNVRLFY
jgi:hypothetical protein